MSILYPLGLLGLIGAVILIIIYIIKPKYQEKKISSTYIWKLSLKYYKRKIPFHWLNKSLLFIIQLLSILFITFLLTRPYIKVDAKSNEKIIIIENSASMQQVENKVTRLEVAIAEAKKLANSANKDERVSIIISEQDASYLAYRETSPSYLEHQLDSVTPSYGEAVVEKAIELANEVQNENYKAEVILFSDNNYESYGYVTYRDMDRKEWNSSILDCSYEFVEGYYEFSARVASFNKNKKLDVVLTIDGETEHKQTISCNDDEINNIKFNNLNLSSFTYAELELRENGSQVKDSFKYDNIFYLYGINKGKFKVEIIEENPDGEPSFFLNVALHALNNKKCSVYVPDSEENIRTSGYDLYIFDSVEPSFIPTDGHIWIINPKENTRIEELNLSIGGSVNNTSQDPVVIQDTNSPLVKNLDMENFNINKYNRIVEYDKYDVILKINDDPILLTSTINKQHIDIINIKTDFSDIGVTVNLPLLIANLVDNTLNYTSGKNLYTVGESADLYFKLDCNEAFVNDTLVYSKTKPENCVSYQFDKPGSYIVNQKIDGTDNKEFIYVRVAESELDETFERGILAIDEYVNSGINYESDDVLDRKEIYPYLAFCLFALLVVEWVVQYREQY